MIQIIGDSAKELASFRGVVHTGYVNQSDEYAASLELAYKLASGNKLLAGEDNEIIGELLPDGSPIYIKELELNSEESELNNKTN